MRQCTTRQANLQEVKIDKVRVAAVSGAVDLPKSYVDGDTGEVVAGLHDERFQWRTRKRQTLRLADLYKLGGYSSQRDKAVSCSTSLEYIANADGSERRLYRFNACQLRLCPICSARKARIMAIRLMRVLKQVQETHAGTQLIFLTLTLKSCSGADLRRTLDLLTKAWHKLVRRRPFDRAVIGWFRAIEITYNPKTGLYHPHIHAPLVVDDDYFRSASGLYLEHDRLVSMWRESLQVDYDPGVDIRSTYVKGQRGKKKAGKSAEKAAEKAFSAAVEAAKYATKGSDFLRGGMPEKDAARVVSDYTIALHGKRMTAMGGVVADAAVALDLADLEDVQDLVHDDDELSVGTAEMLEVYGWHWRVADHVLVWRGQNPDYQGGPNRA